MTLKIHRFPYISWIPINWLIKVMYFLIEGSIVGAVLTFFHSPVKDPLCSQNQDLIADIQAVFLALSKVSFNSN